MTRKSKRPPRIRPCNKDKNWSQPQPIKDNGVFYEYYKVQGILPEEELEEMVATMVYILFASCFDVKSCIIHHFYWNRKRIYPSLSALIRTNHRMKSLRTN